jgi:hypothetical protein
VPASIEGKTLRSILPAVSFSGRAAETPSSRPPDLIDALAQPAAKAATFAEIMPARPFTGVVQGPRVEVAIATQAATAKSDTGPLPVVARVETSPVRTAESDIKSNPLFALINQNAKPRGFDNFNARMEKSPTSVESLSRQIMTADFRPQQSWQDGGQARPKALDPFLAANCYQSMEFGPDGTVKTTTTLPDLSASKIESLYPDKSTSVALTDYLGRITIEQRVDATGQLTSQTTNRFDHTESPLVASLKTVQTATQSIETRQDPTGKVIASKVMPYSDLNAAKSIA